jgi:hypothetical protein
MITWKGVNTSGLGNQLFGIAATLACATRRGDVARFPPWKRAPFFSLSPECFSEIPEATASYEQSSLAYETISANGALGTIELRGNFISPKYFADHESLIRRAFAPTSRRLRTDRIAVHVRRGDYVGGPYVQLEAPWYEAQMAKFPGARFLCFSDAIPECRAMFVHRRDVGFALGGAEDDLHTMAMCAGHIVANSTFSWWGAWLSGQDNVIRPAHYHTEAFRKRTPHVQKWEDEDFWPATWNVAGPLTNNDPAWIG